MISNQDKISLSIYEDPLMFLGYSFFSPLYLSGPIIDYNGFVQQVFLTMSIWNDILARSTKIHFGDRSTYSWA